MDAATVNRLEKGMEYERNRKAPPSDFPALPVIPGGRYTDPAFLELERKHLWTNSWLYAGHVDQLPNPGSYLFHNKSGSPIFIVRDNDDEIRAFYNTCRHRGAPLVKDDAGTLKGGLTCSYHGWTYDLTGRLVNFRDKRDFVGLDPNCQGLIQVRCERFGNWIFINENPDAEPLIEHLGPIPAHFEQFQLDKIRWVDTHGFDVACNVKVLMDAFLEVYHLKSIHQNTVDRFLDHRASTMTLWPNGHSLMLTPNRRPDWVDPGTIGMPEIDTVNDLVRYNNPSYNLYPNLVVPVAPSGMPFLVFWPTSESTMRIDCHWFAPDWGDGPRPALWETRIDNFDRILAEDTQFAPQIQASVESPGFRGITLNYQERRIYHWHEELDRRIGRERVPESLRLPEVLGNFVER